MPRPTDSFLEDSISYEVRLPPREFMYTVDQVCLMLDVNRKYFDERIAFYRGRTTGRARSRLNVVNIAAPEAKPLWRISETDYKLWMRTKGIVFYDEKNGRVISRSRTKSSG